MRLGWHGEYAREIIDRGKWIALHSSTTILITSGDKLFIGALFPGYTLGIYSLASQLFEALLNIVTRIHGSLSLSMFREVVSLDADAFKRNYYQYRLFIELFSFVVAGYLFVGGESLIQLLYDSRYEEAGWMLSVLSMSLLLQPFSIILDAFSSERRFRLIALLGVIRLLALYTGMFLGNLLLGLLGIIAAVALHRVVDVLWIQKLAGERNWVDWRREFLFLPLVFVGGVLGWLTQLLVRHFGF
jgi:O-antigen/teichoic acid export membrane protein